MMDVLIGICLGLLLIELYKIFTNKKPLLTDEQREEQEEREEMEREYQVDLLVFKKMSRCYKCKNMQPYKNTKKYYGYCLADKENHLVSTRTIMCGQMDYLDRWEGEKRLPAVDYEDFKKTLGGMK